MTRIPVRGPLDWSGLLAFYRLRAVPALEEVTDKTYRRITPAGIVEATSHDGARELLLNAPCECTAERARISQMFDLNADTEAIATHIGYPHAWLPGCWDPFELAVRTILGQQISVPAARTFAGRLVALCDALCDAKGFPSAHHLTAIDLTCIGLTARRAATIRLLARAAAENRMDYSSAALLAIPGIGPWTAQYIAMRALKDADAFPSSDLVLRKALCITERELLARAEAWRPYRAYAVIQVWRYAV